MKDEKKVPAIRFKGFTDAWEQRKFSELYKKVSEKNDLSYDVDKIISVANMYFKQESYISNKEYLLTYNIFLVGDIAFEGNRSKNFSYGRFVENTIGNGIVSHVFDVFRPLNEYDLCYWKYAINNENIMKNILARCTKSSTMMTNLVANDFLKETIKVPVLNEQKQIGQLFSKIEQLLTLHQRKYDCLVKLKKSLLEKMFPKNGSDKPDIRFKGFTDAWEQRELENIVNRFDNLRVPVAESLRKKGNIPYYGANGIQGYVDGYTHNGEFILIAEDGANDLNNYPVRYVNGKIWVNNHAHVIQSKQEKSNNLFISFALSSADIKSLIVGGSRSKLTASSLMQIILIVPLIKEQQKIGIFLNTIESLLTLHQRKLEILQNLKKSLLEKMFV